MSNFAIRAEKLGKRYRIGSAAERHDSIREALIHAVKAPVRNLRWLRGLGTIEGEDQTSFWALRDISFEVKHGEVLGLIGRNGAGKSTLLKVLSRITEPSTGEAEIRGRVGSLLEVGTGFHPELTGRENVYLNGSILGMDRAYIDQRFEEIVSFSGVERFIDTPVKRYSSGMYLRLAFAVAAHLEPEVLVVDEVLAVGDAEFQRKCIGKMSDVAKEGRTVLFVSHNMPALTRLCTRAVLLQDGRLIADGPVGDVVAQYLGAGEEGGGARTWAMEEAPGTDAVRLLGVELSSEGRAGISAIEATDELELKLTYAVNRPQMRFRCAAHFYTQGIAAFVSVEPTEMERPRPGVYESVLRIPANLLTEGEYTVNISLFSSRGMKEHHASAKNAIGFLVSDPIRGDSARGDYVQTMVGVMRPKLEWQMRPAEPDAGERPEEPELLAGRALL
jgi:lipopolysaccharide transport system ATP-binding protein